MKLTRDRVVINTAQRAMLLVLALFVVGACNLFEPAPSGTPLSPTVRVSTATATANVPPTIILAPTITVTATSFPEPAGCIRPPDDLSRVQVNGHTLNQRTVWMLSHATELYGGVIEITGAAITQGSYTAAEPLSFGTHSGGGALDISIVARDHWEILWDEVDALTAALRTAGFAAWLREYGELSPDSPIHIHAIAIGDPELSAAAEAQLTGEFGYFRGYTGVPQSDGIPIVDRHDGPVVCAWMLELGYADLSGE